MKQTINTEENVLTTTIPLEEQEALSELNIELGYEVGNLEDYGVADDDCDFGIDCEYIAQERRNETEQELAFIEVSNLELSKIAIEYLEEFVTGDYKGNTEIREYAVRNMIMDCSNFIQGNLERLKEFVTKEENKINITNKLNNF